MANISQMKDSEGTVYDIDAVRVNGHTVNADVPSNAVFTDTTYDVMTGATSSADGTSGLVPAPSSSGYDTKFLRADGTWQVPSGGSTSAVTGVKGDAESTYRTGDINLTAANIGALDLTGGTLSGDVVINIPSETTARQYTYLTLGNSTPVGTVGNSTGRLVLYSSYGYKTQVVSLASSADQLVRFPNSSGILALTDDIPTTAAEVGALALTGGTITGDLIVTGGISAAGAMTTPYLTVDNPSEDTSGATASLQVGNEIEVGTIGNSVGEIRLYGTRDKCTKLVSNVTSADYEVAFPNKSGTVAMISDITASKAGALPTTGGTLTGALTLSGYDLELKTTSSSSNDSSDIVFFYGNDQEKSRIWTDNTYTTAKGPNYRVYKEDGTNLYSGTLVMSSQLTDGSVTKVGTATKGSASKPIYLNAGAPTECNSFVPTSGGTFSGTTYINVPGTTTAGASSYLILGNSTATGTVGNSRGVVRIYGTKAGYTNLWSAVEDTSKDVFLPNGGGTIMLNSGGTFSGSVTINVPSAGTEQANSYLYLGNNKANGTAGSSRGGIVIYGNSTSYTALYSNTTTSAHAVYFPDKGGTIALTNDIPAAVAVKGNAESSYRTGNVNLTPDNIGALALSGGTTTGTITITNSSSNPMLCLGSSSSHANTGRLRLYAVNGKYVNFHPNASMTDNRTVTLPATTGTLALASSSARRYKKDISYDINANLNPHKLLDLPMAQFKYREGADLQYFDMDNLLIDGFIAEDVKTHYPAAVIHNSAGEIESWDERRLLPPMLALIQELYAKVEELTEQLNS